jgi:outer membrane immunogenic protein
MPNSKLFVSAAIAISAISGIGAASAADMAARTYTKAPPMVAQVYDWTGGYIGIEGGYGWGHSNQTDPGIALPPVFVFIGDGNYPVRGGFIGGTLGYNWQTGPWVFGLEGDYSASDISGQSNVCGPNTVAPHPCGTKLDSFGTFRGRIGYAAGPSGNWLLYGTGGLAFGDVHAWDSLTPASGSIFRAGYAVGAGIETSFAPNWTAKLEYLYIDLGRAHYFDIVPGVPESVSFNTNIIRAGINYKWGGPIVARY